MIREKLPAPLDRPWEGEQLCAFAQRWGIRIELARRLVLLSTRLPFEIEMISGARSRTQQQALDDQGRPAADFDLSTHANEFADGCPRLATGADLSPLVPHNDAVKLHLGREARFAGLRWGGGSGPRDPEGCASGPLADRLLACMPSDWQHVDLGPRSEIP